MEYHSIMSAVTVLPKGESIFHEAATTIYIEDEAAGPFLVIRQEPDAGLQEVRINSEEWPVVKAAIDQMFTVCKSVDGK
jgi:hypothetical protein